MNSLTVALPLMLQARTTAFKIKPVLLPKLITLKTFCVEIRKGVLVKMQVGVTLLKSASLGSRQSFF